MAVVWRLQRWRKMMIGDDPCRLLLLLLLLLLLQAPAKTTAIGTSGQKNLNGVQEARGGAGAAGDGGFSYGRVVELTDASFDATIAKHDHVLVDFYAPWCAHCKRLAPELDAAAAILNSEEEEEDARARISQQQMSQQVLLAKIDAEKNARIASQLDIRVYPTLKLFINGFPTDYSGPRQAMAMVSYLRRLSAPDSLHVFSDDGLPFRSFLRRASSSSSSSSVAVVVPELLPEEEELLLLLPVFVAVELSAVEEETAAAEGFEDFRKLAHKHRTRAWFVVLEQASQRTLADFGVDKTPAIVVLFSSSSSWQEQQGDGDGDGYGDGCGDGGGGGDEDEEEEEEEFFDDCGDGGGCDNSGSSSSRKKRKKNSVVFYGPFGEPGLMEQFVEQNFLPLLTALSSLETLKQLQEDGRPIALAILEKQQKQQQQSSGDRRRTTTARAPNPKSCSTATTTTTTSARAPNPKSISTTTTTSRAPNPKSRSTARRRRRAPNPKRSSSFLSKMEAATAAHRSFVFAYVVASEWPAFVRPFLKNLSSSRKKSSFFSFVFSFLKKEELHRLRLPAMVVWDGGEFFYVCSSDEDHLGAAVVGGDDDDDDSELEESQIEKLLRGFEERSSSGGGRGGCVTRHKLQAPSLYERATENVGLSLTYAILVAAILYTVLSSLDWSAFFIADDDERLSVGGVGDDAAAAVAGGGGEGATTTRRRAAMAQRLEDLRSARQALSPQPSSSVDNKED